MHNKSLKKYIGMFIFAILVIAVYKSWNTELLGKFFAMLTPVYIGIIIAYILYFPSSKLERLISRINLKFVKKYSRIVSIAAVYAITGVMIYAGFRILIPMLINNLVMLANSAPAAIDSFLTNIESYTIMGYSVDRTLIAQSIAENISVETVLNYLNFSSILSYVEGLISASSLIVDILIGIIISIYFILDRESFFRLGNRILSCIFRPGVKNTVIKYTHKVNEFITQYVYCRVLDAIIMFFVSLIALKIMGVDYAIVLATVVALCNLVPYIGSIISTVVLIAVALFCHGLEKAIIVGVVMFILQQIDGNIIAPYLVKDRLKINPVWVIIAVILGGGFGGVIGIMLGVPIVAVIRLIANELMYRQEVFSIYKSRHGHLPRHIFGEEGNFSHTKDDPAQEG